MADINEAVTLIVADGLSLSLPDSFDLTYQALPFYDDNERVLASWNDEELLYFITFLKLPPGWLDVDTWMRGFGRDMVTASEKGTYRVLDSGHFTSAGTFNVSYQVYALVIKGEGKVAQQAVFFLANQRHSYVCHVTPVRGFDIGTAQLHACRILGTAFSPASNITLLDPRKVNPLCGIWAGSLIDQQGRSVAVVMELKDDLTFMRRNTCAGERDAVYSGVWCSSMACLDLTSMYGKPTSQSVAPTEHYAILGVNESSLVLQPKGSEDSFVLHRVPRR